MIADDATAFRPVSTKVRGAIRFETAEATDRTAYSCGRSNTLSRGFPRARVASERSSSNSLSV